MARGVFGGLDLGFAGFFERFFTHRHLHHMVQGVVRHRVQPLRRVLVHYPHAYAVERDELRTLFDDALTKLSARDREILVLRHFQELSYKEIAEDMGFLYVASGPLVRSSYKAGELFLEGLIRNENPALQQP